MDSSYIADGDWIPNGFVSRSAFIACISERRKFEGLVGLN